MSTRYFKQLASVAFHEVSFGCTTVILFKRNKIAKGQLGYSVDPKGRSLVGRKDGDWQKEWLVIGYEDGLGDPIFVDVESPNLIVFTAAHGEGAWEAVPIADSFAGFVEGLRAVQSVSKGREHPVGLESNPLSKSERRKTLNRIRAANPEADMSFWELWLEPPDA